MRIDSQPGNLRATILSEMRLFEQIFTNEISKFCRNKDKDSVLAAGFISVSDSTASAARTRYSSARKYHCILIE